MGSPLRLAIVISLLMVVGPPLRGDEPSRPVVVLIGDSIRIGYEFQVNPKSVILELAMPTRGFDFNAVAAKAPLGMEAVAIVEGTRDRPGDRDRGWTVEGRMPWSAFDSTGGRPAPGAEWSFALCRCDYGPENTAPLLMSSAPLRRRSFHRYEDYGRLHFEGPPR